MHLPCMKVKTTSKNAKLNQKIDSVFCYLSKHTKMIYLHNFVTEISLVTKILKNSEAKE